MHFISLLLNWKYRFLLHHFQIRLSPNKAHRNASSKFAKVLNAPDFRTWGVLRHPHSIPSLRMAWIPYSWRLLNAKSGPNVGSRIRFEGVFFDVPSKRFYRLWFDTALLVLVSDVAWTKAFLVLRTWDSTVLVTSHGHQILSSSNFKQSSGSFTLQWFQQNKCSFTAFFRSLFVKTAQRVRNFVCFAKNFVTQMVSWITRTWEITFFGSEHGPWTYKERRALMHYNVLPTLLR